MMAGLRMVQRKNRMKRRGCAKGWIVGVLVSVWGFIPCGAVVGGDDSTVCQELKIRGAIPNFQQKLKTQHEIKVAYLGGSITLADGWRVKTTAWLREAFPDKKITEINSAISGTGAGFGACRLYEHVLKYKPDLLFVEYRVNGGDNSMVRTVEGIVRQTWRLLPETDIVFVYTLSSPMINDIEKRRSPGRNGLELEQVAAHYEIPSIDFGPEITDLAKDGRLLFKGKSAGPGVVVFTSDGVHPGEEGHVLYFDILKRSFKKILEADVVEGAHVLAAPLNPNNWDRGSMYDPDPYFVEGGSWGTQAWNESPVVLDFQKLWRGIECERIIPTLAETTLPGSAIEFTFEGTVFGFFDIGGPETGSVRVTIDGRPPYEVSRFIRYCYRYRPQYYLSEELPLGVHKVRIELVGLTLDKKDIVGAAKFDANPRFKENAFYPIKILLNGKMIE